MTEYKAHQIMSRWKYVTHRYKAAKRNNNRSGAAPQTCKFFEELDELLGERPNTMPVVTLWSRSGLSLAVKPKATATSSATSGAFETSVVSPPEANLEDDLSDDDEGVDQINTSSLSNGGSSAKKARTRGPTVQSRTVQLLKEDLDMRRKEMGQRHEDAKKLVEATLAAAEQSAAAIHDVASAIRYLADKN